MCRVDELQRQEGEIRAAMEAAGNDKHKVISHTMICPTSDIVCFSIRRMGLCLLLLKAVVAAMCSSFRILVVL